LFKYICMIFFNPNSATHNMLLFKKVADLQKYIQGERSKGKIIGFVPTMGALHQGHLSLIKKSKSQADITVCSIFVNPTQFNEKGDLDKYPRTIGADIELLTSVETNVLFLPEVNEVYPPGLDTTLKLDFGALATVMEGAFRPGHFDGMAQVVWRLLNIVEPDQLFMGQKDFQQLTIVREMLRQMQSEIELIMCPIVREEDGLAMSSRNVRLPEAHRKAAVVLSRTLGAAKNQINEMSPSELRSWGMEQLQLPDFKPEYFEIVDGISLQPINSFDDSEFCVACVAVWVGEVRLIDNMVLKEQ